MENSLALVRPDLIREWDYEANANSNPYDISAGAHKKVWWKCDKGHKWQAMVYSRVSGHGCPFCANQLPIIGETDFATLHPELLSEWDYEENGDINPQKLMEGSGRIVSWICKYGHQWKASISNRCKRGSSCPYCAGNLPITGKNDLLTLRPDLAKEWDYANNDCIKPDSISFKSGKKVSWICSKCGYAWKATIANRSAGYNNCPHCDSLAMKYPEVAKEWDYELNTEIKNTPDNISCGSSKKVWWQCSRCGNKWKTAVANRTKGTGCPNCNSHTSFPEQAIFFYIKQYYPDAINRYKLDKYEIDIFIPSIKVGIEYDGVFFHQKKAERENEKDNACYARSITLIRIREKGLAPTTRAINIFRQDNESFSALDKCIKIVFEHIGYNGLSFDTQKDEISIQAQQIQAEKDKSFATAHPDLLLEWDNNKNKGLDPYSISEFSKVKVWWCCPKCRSEWLASISMRSRGKKKCIYCNSLSSKVPELVSEWDYDSNYEMGISPDSISYCSSKVVWWKCRNGHKWQTSVANRSNGGTNCPYCSGNLTLSGKNDLKTLRPELVEEWDYELNNPLGIYPESISASSGKTANWICRKGHKWEAIIANRTKGRNCPYCAGQKVWKGFNDLATTNPKLASEWDYELNGTLKPENIVEGSNKRVAWKCPICHHRWIASVVNRNKYHGCPKCHHKYWECDE